MTNETFLTILLGACGIVALVALLIVAHDEPRYTWRDVATLDDKITEMQAWFDAFARAIGEKLIPALLGAAEACDAFSDAMRDASKTI